MIIATSLYLLTVAVLFVVWAAALVWVRRRLSDPVDNEMQAEGLPALDWAELAFLAEGARSVFSSAIVWYVQNGYGDYDPKTSRLIPLHPLPDDTHFAVRMIAHAGSTEKILDNAKRSYGISFQHLETQGLVIPFSRRVKRGAVGVLQFFASLIPFGCGFFSSFLFFDDVEEQLAKNALGIVVPLSIVFFSGLILMLYSCFLMSMATFPRRLSRRGQSVLRAYKKRYWPKQRWFQVYGPVPNLDENLALAVALYGLLALKRTPLAHLMEGLMPPNID